jgi:hypothetical protein
MKIPWPITKFPDFSRFSPDLRNSLIFPGFLGWYTPWYNMSNTLSLAQLYGIVVRAPDSGPKGPWFKSRARRIFHDFGKVSEYLSTRWWSWLEEGSFGCLYSAGERLYCGMLCMQHICPTKKQYLGAWCADWVFGAPESTVNNVK